MKRTFARTLAASVLMLGLSGVVAGGSAHAAGACPVNTPRLVVCYATSGTEAAIFAAALLGNNEAEADVDTTPAVFVGDFTQTTSYVLIAECSGGHLFLHVIAKDKSYSVLSVAPCP